MKDDDIIQKIQHDVKVIKIENHIQTAAVIVFFLFGISTLADIKKKLK